MNKAEYHRQKGLFNQWYRENIKLPEGKEERQRLRMACLSSWTASFRASEHSDIVAMDYKDKGDIETMPRLKAVDNYQDIGGKTYLKGERVRTVGMSFAAIVGLIRGGAVAIDATHKDKRLYISRDALTVCIYGSPESSAVNSSKQAHALILDVCVDAYKQQAYIYGDILTVRSTNNLYKALFYFVSFERRKEGNKMTLKYISEEHSEHATKKSKL